MLAKDKRKLKLKRRTPRALSAGKAKRRFRKEVRERMIYGTKYFILSAQRIEKKAKNGKIYLSCIAVGVIKKRKETRPASKKIFF